MALTAVLTCTPDSTTAGLRVACALVITNGGSSDVELTGVDGYVALTGVVSQACAAAPPMFALGPGMDLTVPGSGTLTLAGTMVAYAPPNYTAQPGMPGSIVYDVGARIYAQDGSNIAATVDSLTVAGIVV